MKEGNKMQIQQLSIFVENKSGRLAEITELIGQAGVDIRAISVADTSDFGILRLIVSDPERAVPLLRGAGITVSLTDVIAVGMMDVPGAFAKAVRTLADHGINVDYMYAFTSRDLGKACVLLHTSDNEAAVKVLGASGIEVVQAEDIR